MTRGTCFRNSTHCGTWFNPALNQPLFNEDECAFEINKNKKIRDEDRLAITKNTLNRLAVDRPEHRTIRDKFDKTDPDCLAQQINKTMTFEDNIHQGEAETVFRSSLRETRGLRRGKLEGGGGAPPAFADAD